MAYTQCGYVYYRTLATTAATAAVISLRSSWLVRERGMQKEGKER